MGKKAPASLKEAASPRTKGSSQKHPETRHSLNSRASPSSLMDEDLELPTATSKKRGPKTRLTVKYNAGFPNNVHIRGQGAGLSWDKGTLLKNIKEDEWVWETSEPFSSCQFKILINDSLYEAGENHEIHCGSSIQHTPQF